MVSDGVCMNMRVRRGEFDRIQSVLSEVDPQEPLTAREILKLLKAHGEELDNPHRVATVLGRHADDGGVEVIEDYPNRYSLRDR